MRTKSHSADWRDTPAGTEKYFAARCEAQDLVSDSSDMGNINVMANLQRRSPTKGEQDGINQRVALTFKALSDLSHELVLAGQTNQALDVDQMALRIRRIARTP